MNDSQSAWGREGEREALGKRGSEREEKIGRNEIACVHDKEKEVFESKEFKYTFANNIVYKHYIPL